MVAKTAAPQQLLHRRAIQLDPNRHRFHNKAALILTVASCVLLLSLSLIFGGTTSSTTSTSSRNAAVPNPQDSSSSTFRFLEDNNNNDNDDNSNENEDFSRYSCRYIYEQVADPGYAQCRFARTCNGGEGVWAPWVFCWYDHASVTTLFLWLSPIMILWMVTLFRLMGSTAEDYFSPSLEMFSVKLGLPPRFAGVSLLALGNGAADVSATMSAIVNDEVDGYKLSLGALTGAAMLVGGVVSGVVVLVAKGVPCRGALVRDVAALGITIVVVWTNLQSGEIGTSSITLFFSLYGVFVGLVLVADVYHRAVVLPRLARQADHSELERQWNAEEQVHQLAGESLEQDAAQQQQPPSHPHPHPHLGPPTAMQRVITAFSNYDNITMCHNQDDTTTGAAATAATTTNDATGEGWGVGSMQLDQDGPIVLHGQHGILHGDGQGGGGGVPSPPPDTGGAYTLVEDHIDQICAGDGSLGITSTNWKGAWHDGKQEVMTDIHQVWEDICYNGDINKANKFFLVCELPFTLARKATVPIPCEGYYNRGLISLSIALSPFWFAYYIYSGHDINLLATDSIFYFLMFWLFTIFVAASVLRFAPGGEGHMAMGVATPIALYGFIMAATWIDYVADHLVSLLDFMGIVLHIPGAIMGLTILAWGNSMGDLSANMTMARKGLANMAMTACFAGPIFNLLIGLGLGFSNLAAQTGNPMAQVALSPPILCGFVFVLLNCASILFTGIVVGKGRIESYYGYVALTLYTIYVITSIALQFSKYGDS